MLTSLRLPKHWWDEAICLLSLGLLVFLIGFWNLLPSISKQYIQAGDKAYESNQLISARGFYELAVKRAENSEAHYKLGRVYKELRQTNDAALEYEIALRDPTLKSEYALDAYNTLIRSNIQKLDYTQAAFWVQACHLSNLDNHFKSDCTVEDLAKAYLQTEKYTDAAALLLAARSRGEFKQYDLERRYVLTTYLGRAFLGQTLPAAAEETLRQAIKLQYEKAPAHCLLAQALDQRKDQQQALAEWEQCIAYTSLENPDEAIWLNMARQRLAAAGEQK